MPAELANVKRGGSGIAFLVAAGIVFEIIAYCCSSPQTTEINAHSRADTLMKYVYIGEAESVLFLGAAVLFDRRNALPIITGGGSALVISHLLYQHAKAAGLRSIAPGTED